MNYNCNKCDESLSQTRKEDKKPEVWNFVSAPSLHPMKVTINVDKPGTSSGSIFVAPFTLYGAEMIGQTGALIFDQTGNPIWFDPLCSKYIQNADFRVQSYFGRPVLTMWEGTISGTQTADPNLPAGDPEPGAYYKIINRNYKVIKKVIAQYGYTSDLHEFVITKRNTALFTAVKQIPADLTTFGGSKNGFIDDYSIQEIDLETGRLIFFWNALAHVNPADSMMPASSAVESNNIWDCYHMNSIDEGPDNTLLISMRNMWAIYTIDKKTGNVIWQLGGKQTDFNIEPGAGFSWQHDARYRCDDRISIFDDACCASSTSPPECQSHGLLLQLDYQKMTARAIRTYFHDPILYVPSQGNVQNLPNGNQFIGWGQEPYLSEYANAGNTINDPSLNFLYDMQFPNKNMTYRAFKNKWVGLPLYPPSIAFTPSCEDVAVSWNGSTETASWQVLAGPSPLCLYVVIESTPRTGFETKIKIKSKEQYYQVNALDACGLVIGTSQIINIKQNYEL